MCAARLCRFSRVARLFGKMEGLTPTPLVEIGGEVVVRVDEVDIRCVAAGDARRILVVQLVVFVNVLGAVARELARLARCPRLEHAHDAPGEGLLDGPAAVVEGNREGTRESVVVAFGEAEWPLTFRLPREQDAMQRALGLRRLWQPLLPFGVWAFRSPRSWDVGVGTPRHKPSDLPLTPLPFLCQDICRFSSAANNRAGTWGPPLGTGRRTAGLCFMLFARFRCVLLRMGDFPSRGCDLPSLSFLSFEMRSRRRAGFRAEIWRERSSPLSPALRANAPTTCADRCCFATPNARTL